MGAKAKKALSKMWIVLVIAIVIIAAAVAAGWWFFLPEPEKKSITLSVSPGEVQPDESVTVSGSTSPVIADATVTLTYTKPDSNLTRVRFGTPLRSNYTRTTTTDEDGKFTDTYSSNVTGKWTVTAEIEEKTSDPASFYVFISPPIKVGAIGPMAWIQGVGIREGCMLAAGQINEAGGLLGRKVVVVSGDEGSIPERGEAEMTRLCSEEKAQFIFGGFRTEIADPMREIAVAYKTLFILCGSATPWLIDCATTTVGEHSFPCGRCVGCRRDPVRAKLAGVPCDDAYKYLFRATPTNTDVIFANFLVPYLRNYLIPDVLFPGLGLKQYEDKVRVAVIVEELAWSEELRSKLNTVGPLFFGPEFSATLKKGKNYYWGVSPFTKDFSPILAELKSRGVHVIFEVFSGEEGLAFIKQWKDLKIPAIPIGVNVLSQDSNMWDWTDGKCEYETIISTMGTRTPVAPATVPFWDAYVERWGHTPIYTSFGAYDGLIGLAETIEQAALDHPELTDPATWKTLYENRTLYDILIPYLEKSDRGGILGRSKYTKTHDIFAGGWYAEDYGTEEYVNPMMIQWQKTAEGVGEMVPVSCGKREITPAPEWVKDFKIPPWMLPD